MTNWKKDTGRNRQERQKFWNRGSFDISDSPNTGMYDRDTENVTVNIEVYFQLGFPKFILSELLRIRTTQSYKNNIICGS